MLANFLWSFIAIFLCGFIGIGANDGGVKITFGNEECEDCNMSLDSSIKTMAQLMASLEPIVLTNVKLCRTCEIRGAKSIERYGDACTTSDKENPDIKIHTIGVKWDQLVLTCYCKLSPNPAIVAQKVAERLKTGFEPCASPPKDIDQTERLQGISATVLQPKNILSLTACQPKSLLGPKESDEGVIEAVWSNVKTSLTLRVTDDEDFKVVGGKLLEHNFNDIVTTCKGDKNFMGSCKCILESKFLLTVLGQVVDMLLPCYLAGDKMKELVKMLICQE